MNVPQYRGWRFTYPWVSVDPGAKTEQGGTGLGINLAGGIDMVQGDDDVRQAILLLISTVPGERVMRPEYGCLIHRLVFAPNDDTTAGLAIFYVRNALEKWEPRVDVLRVDATRNPETPEWLDILLEYRVRTIMQTQTLQFSFDLTGVGRL